MKGRCVCLLFVGVRRIMTAKLRLGSGPWNLTRHTGLAPCCLLRWRVDITDLTKRLTGPSQPAGEPDSFSPDELEEDCWSAVKTYVEDSQRMIK